MTVTPRGSSFSGWRRGHPISLQPDEQQALVDRYLELRSMPPLREVDGERLREVRRASRFLDLAKAELREAIILAKHEHPLSMIGAMLCLTEDELRKDFGL